ncbi:MAG: pyridoxal 5'-phosphate synthase glutaminase subunit PdxT [Halobacteriales archaeon]|nr:pyridoxal 5'-phosphate synthase glutaminase subunit PdxT [Halobacteriales archaeon]
MSLTAGVIAVQGDVSEHARMLEAAGRQVGNPVEVREIRQAGIVPECDLLAMPGGESTAISRLLEQEGIDSEIISHVEAGNPLLATCAGLIVAARDAHDERVTNLGVLDITVDRNAFGRQKDSFETQLSIEGMDEPFHAVFIRAPVIAEVGDGAEVIAEFEGQPVAVRDGPVVGTAFHPELTDSTALHERMLFDEARQAAEQ